ncbi:sigma-54-dependent transcriptional regulator [Thermovenabulum sp.]|uniref:sigma-54-dependent transcriptional regulator n=1 Tax=Thermovenabulum sp. TaxID=3100335 RepID=UPI003C7DC9F8
MKQKLLIVDDDDAICSSLEFALEDDFLIYTTNSEEQALSLAEVEDFGIILLDLRLGKNDGLETLKKLKMISPKSAIIIMTAYGSIESSVEAMKNGAYYYITKPIDLIQLKTLLNKALEYINLKSRVEYLNEKLIYEYQLSGMVGSSKAMQKVFELIEKVKEIDSNVMVTGESGTGKELVARAIHFCGRRKDKPFEAVNCAAIPQNLLEAELFGYEKGAFTGAEHRKKGIFEIADGGTIFLDEITEMDISLQAKLLRVVQEKEIMPVGSEKRKKVNVRIISATNKDIKKEVKEGRFREDLFFRLNVINIHIPPLRERREDIPQLAGYFIKKYSKEMGKNVEGIDDKALEILCKYDYKGNVRELQNILERAVALSDKKILGVEDLPTEVVLLSQKFSDEFKNLIPVFVGEDLQSVEKKVILYTLKYCKGSRKKTAKMLKISERNLRYKLKEYEEEEKN